MDYLWGRDIMIQFSNEISEFLGKGRTFEVNLSLGFIPSRIGIEIEDERGEVT